MLLVHSSCCNCWPSSGSRAVLLWGVCLTSSFLLFRQKLGVAWRIPCRMVINSMKEINYLRKNMSFLCFSKCAMPQKCMFDGSKWLHGRKLRNNWASLYLGGISCSLWSETCLFQKRNRTELKREIIIGLRLYCDQVMVK